MDKILLIVDPQVDFISGSLAVEGAKEKMDALASALQNGEIDCDYVMVTKDFHPSNHCSFKENGGQWPPHCVIGIGTNLTNDTGFKPANIVMKLISCQMNANQPVYGCVKLSDDAGKHTGENKEVNACLVELGL